MNSNSQKDLLIEMEKATLAAYKKKNEAEFTKNFSADYVGIANDGMQTANSEVRKMHQLDLDELHLEDAKIFFPNEETAIVTYKMVRAGKNGRAKDFRFDLHFERLCEKCRQMESGFAHGILSSVKPFEIFELIISVKLDLKYE